MIIGVPLLSVICFLSPMILQIVLLIVAYTCLYTVSIGINNIVWMIFLSNVAIMNIIIGIVSSGYAYKIGVRATFLGLVFSAGLLIAQLLPRTWNPLGWYMCVLAFFHYSEFLTIAITNPKTLSIDSFILNHSNQYILAAVSSWIEFLIEAHFFPGLKLWRVVSYVGLFLCLGGECMRKCAMWTASTNFNHVVQSVRHSDHQLVTHGIYSFCRHPSYVGWFFWSMGTQMILVNPVCFVIYVVASWKFFYDRIRVEEMTLINFFGQQYLDYKERVPTGLPFITGSCEKPTDRQTDLSEEPED